MPTGHAEETHDGLSHQRPLGVRQRHSPRRLGLGTARVIRDGRLSGERRVFVVPHGAVEIHDTWQVAGLRGDGELRLLPARATEWTRRFTWDMERAVPRRGGALYRLGMPGFVANEHAAFALGRRAACARHGPSRWPAARPAG
jgi:hypothetical protein